MSKAKVNVIRPIPLNEIIVNDLNVRKLDREAKINELAESIALHGLLQPIVLLGEPDKPPYKVIIGQRRYLAHKYLNLPTIQSVIISDLNDEDAILLSLVENIQRVDLQHEDKLNAITKLYKLNDNNVSAVAKKLGISKVTIYDYLKIDDAATEKAKEFLSNRKVSKQDIKRIIKIAKGDNEKADEILEHISELTKFQKDRLIEISEENPELKSEELIAEASKPKRIFTLVLALTNEFEIALNNAKSELSLEAEEIATIALREWLTQNRFIN